MIDICVKPSPKKQIRHVVDVARKYYFFKSQDSSIFLFSLDIRFTSINTAYRSQDLKNVI